MIRCGEETLYACIALGHERKFAARLLGNDDILQWGAIPQEQLNDAGNKADRDET